MRVCTAHLLLHKRQKVTRLNVYLQHGVNGSLFLLVAVSACSNMFSMFLLAAVTSCYAGTSEIKGPPLWISHDTDQSNGGRDWLTHASATCVTADRVLRDCQDILLSDTTVENGRYEICPRGAGIGQVSKAWCDMEGGGWTVLLKRLDGSIDFNRNWDKMKYGAGDVDGEYWLGLEDVYRLTTSGDYSVMVEIRKESRTWTETYDSFALSDEARKYTLRVGGFDRANSSNTEPVLGHHNNVPFSTYDKDNYRCAAYCKAPGWFFSDCASSMHPFGAYTSTEPGWFKKMHWHIEGDNIKPDELIMKIKRRP